ncbi:ATP-binding cassette domain-containing protein [Aquipuribacter sp. MA13-6]|uniref:ATP-binding cassette domain-containing protein n=1 Tax=unclassified Aquipuribacter TaxID=2635084 RepID=UPI003EE82B63
MSAVTTVAAELVDVSRSFRGTPALQDVRTALPQDAITGLLGRNGAGKTTIMRLLTGHLRPTSGRVLLAGEDPWENAPVLARTCFVREGQKYPDGMRVAQVLRAAALVLPGWDEAYARDLAADFGLPGRRAVSKLSRGMLSAVGVVVGLASRAPVTFFDEPYLGLDAVARQLFYDRLLADYAEHPRTVVLSTHLIDEVADLLEHVVVVDRGRVVIDASADDLRGRGAVVTGPDRAVTSLLAGRPVLATERLGGTVRVAVDWSLPPSDVAEAERLGLGLEPMSLQQLVVRTSTGPPRAGSPGAHADLGRSHLHEGAGR